MSDPTDPTAIDPEDEALVESLLNPINGRATFYRILTAHAAALAEIERLRKWLECMEHWMRQTPAKEIPVIDPEAFDGFDEWLESERSRKPPADEPQYPTDTPGTVVTRKVGGLAALSQQELDDAVTKQPPAVEPSKSAEDAAQKVAEEISLNISLGDFSMADIQSIIQRAIDDAVTKDREGRKP